MAPRTDVPDQALSPLDRLQQNSLEDLRTMDFEDLVKQATDAEQAISAAQLGDGFTKISDEQKEFLVGVPLIVLDWEVHPSKQYPGSYFTSARVRTGHPVPRLENGTCFRVNDGSTGIHRQLEELRQAGFKGMLICRHGLRVSKDYVVTRPRLDDNGEAVLDEKTGRPIKDPVVDPVTGKEVHGTTFYLDTTL